MRCLLPLVFVCLALTAAPSTPRPQRPFIKPVLAASFFTAAWAYRHDRPRLEAQLEWLSIHGFDAIRALGVVGDAAEPDYWDGREIDWRWPDYDEVIAGLTDLAFDKYGLQVQWTIFADAQKNTPRRGDRDALIERFLTMSRGRERKILAFEVANEFWNNGFDGEDGINQLRTYAARLRAASSIPVAASAHRDELCGLYGAGAVDFATIHFDRGTPDARWAPLNTPWNVARRPGRFAACEMPEEATNNEPAGPGAYSSESIRPIEIVMSAVNTYLSGIPVYVFHSGPGVRDDPTHPERLRPVGFDQLRDAALIFDGLSEVKHYIPPGVLTWRSFTATDRDFPFTVTGPVQVAIGATDGRRFVVALSGIAGRARLVARKGVTVRQIDPMTGTAADAEKVKSGESFFVSKEAVVLDGNVEWR